MSFTSPAPIGDYPGSARVSEFVTEAAKLGHDAIAFTELGSMRGMYETITQCKKHGVRPVFGCEFYVAPDMYKKMIPAEKRAELVNGVSPSDQADVIIDYATEHGYMVGSDGRELTTVTLYAGNVVGLRNMFRMLYLSWGNEAFYTKPRIDMALLSKHAEGVWVTTGGPNSYVNRPIIEGKRRDALDRLAQLHDLFGDRLRLAVRPQRIFKQNQVNVFAREQSDRLGIPMIAESAAHYLREGDHRMQKMLSSFGSRGKLDMAGLDLDDYRMRDGDAMAADLTLVGLTAEQAAAACNETVSFAANLRAEFELDAFAMIIPDIETGGAGHDDFLRQLCEASTIWSQIPAEDRVKYNERLDMELVSLGRRVSPNNDTTFASYLLYVREVMEMGRELGIDFGPGRGSAAGSLASWLIGITQIDPIEHGLSFERFLNPQRIGPPDIDVDCDPSKRMALFAKMRERWGVENVAQISAFGKNKGKAVVKNVCRELGIDFGISNKATASIETRSDFDYRPYSAAMDAFVGYHDLRDSSEEEFEAMSEEDRGSLWKPPTKECAKLNQEHPEVLEYIRELEGTMRVLGIHAGGVVAAPRPLWEYVPMESRKNPDDGTRVYVVGFEKVGTEETGLLKIDMLGVNTIATIAMAIAAVNEARGSELEALNALAAQADYLSAIADNWHNGLWDEEIDLFQALDMTREQCNEWSKDPEFTARRSELAVPLTMESIPYDDAATLQAFTAGDLTGVFQFDSNTARGLAKGVVFDTFGVIADMTALGRPGPLDNGTAIKYIERKAGRMETEDDYSPAVSELLKATHGVMVFQEQVMAIFGELAGHSNPDKMRSIIGKKKVVQMEAERPGFIAGMAARAGMDEEGADHMFDDIAKFGRYSFNKSHSIAYGRISYICQYLKVHHSLEWGWALISTAKPERRRTFAKDAAKRGIKLLPPDVSISGYALTMDRTRGAVLGSLTDIKGVGDKAASSIVGAQPFATFEDFMDRVDRKRVNAGVIEKLARAGALNALLPNVRVFVENRTELFAASKRKTWAGWGVALAAFEPAEIRRLDDFSIEVTLADGKIDKVIAEVFGAGCALAEVKLDAAMAAAEALGMTKDQLQMYLNNPTVLYAQLETQIAELRADLARDWTPEERALEAATVNPMALENPYSKLIGSLRVDVHEDFASDEFMAEQDNKGVWVAGTLTDVREWQNLPFGGDTATAKERAHRGFGAALVNGSLEDQRGDKVKIKIPWNVYEHCSEAATEGTPVLAFVVPGQERSTLYAKLIIDLEGMRNGSLKNLWTGLVTSGHPALSFEFPSDPKAQYDSKISKRDYAPFLHKLHHTDVSWKLPAVGVVTDVFSKITKNGEGDEMAWIGLLTASGQYIRITAFPSDWNGGYDRRARTDKPPMKGHLRPGMLAQFEVRSDDWSGIKSCVLAGGWRVYGEGKNS